MKLVSMSVLESILIAVVIGSLINKFNLEQYSLEWWLLLVSLNISITTIIRLLRGLYEN